MDEPQRSFRKQAVVQVPAFEEEDLTTTLDGIAGQTIPDTWQVDFEAWVTPSPRYDTADQAAAHDVFELHSAPPGKLSARNVAHDHALEAGADAIVTWDADSRPAHGTVLASILSPLEHDDDVVAVNGNPKVERSPLGMLGRAAATVEEHLFPHLNGQLSAFEAYAWEQAGPFDETVDQRDVLTVRAEEEHDFRRRLEGVGDVARAKEAVVLEDSRRVNWHVWRAYDRFGHYPADEWTQRRGEASFWFPE